MLFKIILIFLLAMLLVGMIGKVLFPNAYDRALRRRKSVACRNCGRPVIGRQCECQTRKGGGGQP